MIIMIKMRKQNDWTRIIITMFTAGTVAITSASTLLLNKKKTLVNTTAFFLFFLLNN